MELLNRYLNAVAIRLPKARRADIKAELRDTLLSQFEEHAAQLGRVLTTTDVETLLRRYGNPIVVAARYGSHHEVIGSDLYPFYVVALQVLLGAQLTAHMAWAVLAIVLGESAVSVLLRTLNSVWIVGCYLLGLTTLSFMILERLGVARLLTQAWSPRWLPKVGARRSKAPWRLLLDCLMILVVALWATAGVRSLAPLWQWPQSAHIRATPTWVALCWSLVIVTMAQLMVHLLDLFRPQWTRISVAANVTVGLAILFLLGALVRDRRWFEIADLPPAAADAITQSLQVVIGIAIGMISIVTLVRISAQVLRLWRGEHIRNSLSAATL